MSDSYHKTEIAQVREMYLKGPMRAVAEYIFNRHAGIGAIALAVAQYWDDEASDAVHAQFVYYKTDHVPSKQYLSPVGDIPDVYNTDLPYSFWSLGKDAPYCPWHSNSEAVSLFAACVDNEGATQEDNLAEAYNICAIYRRGPGGKVDVEVLGEVPRPHCDGVGSEWQGLEKKSMYYAARQYFVLEKLIEMV